MSSRWISISFRPRKPSRPQALRPLRRGRPSPASFFPCRARPKAAHCWPAARAQIFRCCPEAGRGRDRPRAAATIRRGSICFTGDRLCVSARQTKAWAASNPVFWAAAATGAPGLRRCAAAGRARLDRSWRAFFQWTCAALCPLCAALSTFSQIWRNIAPCTKSPIAAGCCSARQVWSRRSGRAKFGRAGFSTGAAENGQIIFAIDGDRLRVVLGNRLRDGLKRVFADRPDVFAGALTADLAGVR